MNTYFAYGTLIGTQAMQALAPSALPVGVMRLDGFELDFAETSKPGTGGCWLRPVEHGVVYGVQYEMTETDKTGMDAAAGVPEGLWVNLSVMLTDASGEPVTSTTYTIPGDPPAFRPTPEYTDKIRQGLATVGIPQDYISRLNRRLDAMHAE